VFEQYAQILGEKYPSISIVGDTFPPTPTRSYAAQILGLLKMALIICVMTGKSPFTMLGSETPQWFDWMINNKFYACLMTFFFVNMVEGQLLSTGAFEVSLNDVPVWSKIETGRLPSPPELFQIMDNAIRFKPDTDSKFTTDSVTAHAEL